MNFHHCLNYSHGLESACIAFSYPWLLECLKASFTFTYQILNMSFKYVYKKLHYCNHIMKRISICDRVYQPRSHFPTMSYTYWSIQVMKYMYQENSSRSSTIKTGTQSYTLVVVCDDDTDLQTYMPCHVF